MWQIRFRIAQPGNQPIGINLAADFRELRPNVATNQLRFARASYRQRMASRAEHLPEAQFALRNQFRVLAPRGDDCRRNFVRRGRFGLLDTEVSRYRAKLGFGKPELRHARLFLGLVAVDGDVAILIHNRPRLLQPFVYPFAADFRADAGKIRTEHRGPVNALQSVATLAV